MNSQPGTNPPPKGRRVPATVRDGGATPGAAVVAPELLQAYHEMLEATAMARLAEANCHELIKDIDNYRKLTYLGHVIFWLGGMLIGAALAKHGWISL